jgi:hypothetical protein
MVGMELSWGWVKVVQVSEKRKCGDLTIGSLLRDRLK